MTTFTRNTLPIHGMVYVFVTGERFTPESIDHGDAAERGWCYDIGSRDMYDSRNDVAPVVKVSAFDAATDDDEWAEVVDAVNALGAYEHEAGSRIYYGVDDRILDHAEPDTYRYAVVVMVKFYDTTTSEWTEAAVEI